MKEDNLGLEIYLLPTYFVDSNHPDVIDYAHNIVKDEKDPLKQAILLYLAVRDDFRYNPYNINLHHYELKASTLLNRSSRQGYCTEKACLYNAVLRVVGIPSRFHFFNVRNHIGVEKYYDLLKTDVLAYHACSEVYLNNKWVKATPAFNKELCEKTGVAVLEFNGIDDSIFQQYSPNGSEFMEYLHDYGTCHDVPHDMYVQALKEYYPHFFIERQDICMNL
ncbi:MAG: transglutaminase-like domain-containing protein [Chitinophagales bacterium]|nr:transglutaminase-like domain-containing protein [Chitinophagales bacterium]MCZ2394464.1 transglutaminase-like domain-containing protein [Chitinophagales bacterium]